MSKLPSLRLEIEKRIEVLKERGLYRTLSGQDGLVDFCSNDYLSFARNSIVDFEGGALQPQSSGSGASRLISGNVPIFDEVEDLIANYHEIDSALIFPSGYMANLSVLSSIVTRQDTILFDQSVHASIRDGIRLARSRAFSFRHNSIADLKKKIDFAKGRCVIVVESRYSMEGDSAPLVQICEIASQRGCEVVVDEAHSLGIDGAQGEGLVQSLGLHKFVLARIVTFGKALGSHGAAVLSGQLVRRAIINFGRSFIYTTGMSPRSVVDIGRAYQMLPRAHIQRMKLKALSHSLSQELPDSCASTNKWSPIHRVVVSGNLGVLRLQKAARSAGLGVVAIRHPTVPRGQEQIRICLHAHNTKEEVCRLAGVIRGSAWPCQERAHG